MKENFVLSMGSRSSEKLVHGIKVLMAKNYIDNLSEETKKGMREKAEQGIWPGYAPLGYRNVVGANGKRTIEPDPDIAPLIRQVFEWYVSGEHSIRDVSKLVQQAGLAFRRSNQPVRVATVHQILRNRIYTGDFDWNGETFRGSYEAIVSHEVWEKAQAILDHRFAKRHRRVKHTFAFSGLIACGHCGSSLVAEIKKQRYVYYHCTGSKGKCGERYVREEVLEEQFVEMLRGLRLDEELLGAVTRGLRESLGDVQRHRRAAVGRLQSANERLEGRIDAMYVDRLEGRVSGAYFDRKAKEWRAEQQRLLRTIEEHQAASQTYLEEGIRLLGVAQQAHKALRNGSTRQKRTLLAWAVSNCTWRSGKLEGRFRQPLEMLAEAALEHRSVRDAKASSDARRPAWLRELDSNQRPFG